VTAAAGADSRDWFDAGRACAATGLLGRFNDAELLTAADVHVAGRLAELGGDDGEAVKLAAAFAVRGPRLGHVFVDLATLRDTAAVESEEPVDLSSLPWPTPDRWLAEVAASRLTAVGEEDPHADRPLRLLGSRLYLDRYWREERAVAADLRAMATPAPDVSAAALAAGLARLFADDTDEGQRRAAAAAVRRRLAVVAGGPGTGKTTTVARIVALLDEQARACNGRPPLVALAAPTGKAAARLQEAVHAEAAGLAVAEGTRELLLSLRASTLHRLLGARRGTHSRFAHDRDNRLPHDVVIVDETSMVPLSLMSRLVEAVRADARLVLVGDPGQLASIEAGVVLADIVGAGEAAGSGHPIAEGIVVLERVHRYGGGIAALAQAIRRGDGDGAVRSLRGAPGEVTWLAYELDAPGRLAELGVVRERSVAAARAVLAAARAGAGSEALRELGRFRLLCAHRRGPHGVSEWTSRVREWLSDAEPDLDLEQRDPIGRPLLVTENDYELGLYNGDTGVIVQGADGRASAVFERGGELLRFSPLRLGPVDTVYAMTIHKSQGSQFDTAAVLLPSPTSPILTRELLYTAVTRARRRLILVGGEAAVRTAVERPVTRASGLGERLWSPAA